MIYRQFRRVSDGQWVAALIARDADTFTIPEESHRSDIAAGLSISPADLETVEASEDVRTGTLLAFPAQDDDDTSYDAAISDFVSTIPGADSADAQGKLRALIALIR